jgi:cation diffusion facilitator family transporter
MEAGERLALASIGVNLMVTGLKYFLGWFSGSLALLADAVHSSADVVSSASIWGGIRLSRRKSKRFPYGLYKLENLVALGTSALILLAGYEIVHTVLGAGPRVRADRLPPAMIGVVLIMGVLWGFSRYEMKKARKLSSPSLEADAYHLTTDLFSSGVILVGLAGTFWRVPFPLDKVAALIIVALIAYSGVKIALDAIRVLLDASLDFNTLNAIRDLIMETPQVSKVIALTGRNSGRFKFVEAELALKVRELQKAHFVANQIESRIKAEVPNVDHVLIHYEPVKKDTLVIALPVAGDLVRLSEHFGEAPYFLVLTLRDRDRRLLEEKLLANPFATAPSGKGIKASELLVAQGVDRVIAAKSFEHKGPHYVLADAGVSMEQTEERDVGRLKAALMEPEEAAADSEPPSPEGPPE